MCIGYGFNDEHIQPIILEENQLNKKPIVIVTKSITEKMKKLFIDNDSDNCLLIAEGDSSKGSKIVYFSTKVVEFDESFWHLDKFYKLWFE
ncbi:MAG: hypothetical protein U5K00_21280 [Melioribacteraceae bacterium]|nr:hypothetical protein [Melioribacteraceae bacterium]